MVIEIKNKQKEAGIGPFLKLKKFGVGRVLKITKLNF